MQSRTAVRSISAAALAGGLTLGLGVAAPATAMPVHDRADSLGQLCHAAAQAAGDDATAPPSSIEGLPGLRCGQAFGPAAFAGDDSDETTETDATETEDAGTSDDDAYEADDTSDDAYGSEEADDTSDDAAESESESEDGGDDAYEAQDDGDSYESDDGDSDEQEHADDGDHEGDDGGDWGEHSEHDD